ncbi:MAG: type III pantothenate kinase [Candidatus Eisenbacteria bacterium]|uniref:Type III pantothenate kinase n=1 Tax=Eiseniibacteriota bacterium TaxID=2212470 RepID=A0A538U3J9_UNCEI|nr:MAG: type III pantothenate kinase [Candidatus Eisenbacteria bacterium]
MAVDLGTSETKLALMEGRQVRRQWRLTTGRATSDEARLRVESLLDAAGTPSGALVGAVVCSVAPALTLAWVNALGALTGGPPIEVGVPTVRHLLPIRYRDPSAVGADRLANAIAARDLYGTPAVVVDLGTATTFDCVSREGAFLGGVIAPGVMTSAEELYRRAARLARVELRRPDRALGRSTEEALQAGVMWGAAGQVDALVRRLALEMKGTPHVIATGGLAQVIAPECETINRIDDALTLKGMTLIWEGNR